MKRLNEKQLQSVKNRVQNIQLMINAFEINAFEYPSYLLIIPNGDKYGIYLGDALMRNVEGSFIDASNALQGVAQKIRAHREEQRPQIDVLKSELKYYLNLMDE